MQSLVDKPNRESKYPIGSRVESSGWTGSKDEGRVTETKWIYHIRFHEWTWGYKIDWDNNGPGFSFVFIPEAYLNPVDESKATEN